MGSPETAQARSRRVLNVLDLVLELEPAVPPPWETATDLPTVEEILAAEEARLGIPPPSSGTDAGSIGER